MGRGRDRDEKRLVPEDEIEETAANRRFDRLAAQRSGIEPSLSQERQEMVGRGCEKTEDLARNLFIRDTLRVRGTSDCRSEDRFHFVNHPSLWFQKHIIGQTI